MAPVAEAESVTRDATALREVEDELRRVRAALAASAARTGELELQLAMLRGIADSATAPAFSVDRSYRYTSFNRHHARAMKLLCGVDVAIGASLLDCMTVAADRETARRNLDRALAGESFAEEAFSGGDLRTRSYFRVAHGPIRDEAGAVIGAAVLATDLTEHRRAEDLLAASEGRYRRSAAVNAARLHLVQFAATHAVDAILEETLNEAEALTGSLIGFFHFVDDDQQTISLQSWSTRTKAQFCTAAGQGGHYPIAQAGVWVDAAHRRAPVIHNDYASLPHRKGLPVGHAAVVREVVVPVIRGEKITAIVGVGNKGSDYGAEDVEAVSLLADLAWEITSRQRAEEQLRRMNRQLRAISECNEALMRAGDEQGILDEVCRIVCDRAGYGLAWVGFAEQDAERSIRPVAAAGDDRGYVAGVRASWGEGARSRGPSGTAVRTGRTVVLQDTASSPDYAPWLEAATARGIRSVIALPLQDEDRHVFGALNIYAGERDAFSPEEIRLLEELAGDLAFGITVLRGRARRKQAERELALLSFALDNVREAAYLVDEEGKIRSVNDAGCRALGYRREELLGWHVVNVDRSFTPERWPGHWRELRERRTLVHETVHRARDGRTFPVEVSANYFEYEGQGYDLALVHDITERLRLEEQLRQAQKMEAVGTLAGGVAHDFNNILTGIIGYGYVLQEGLPATDPLQDPVAQILAASERAAQLTRALLAFSRKQVLNPRPVDLNEVVRGIEQLLRRVIGEDVELSTELAGEPLVTLADTGQLEQVLMNLATNARDAMPHGGTLSIATRPFDLDERYAAAHGWGTPGPHAVLSVSDTGVGMDEATRQKAFEPFFTTKEKGKGTGLGLSIVYGIVKQHGGAVDVYSEPGKGTSFKILLPRTAGPTAGARPAHVEAPPATGTETILLAEDDAIVRGLIATVLRGSGYHVIEAVDGADALAQWTAHGAGIDLLLLDVVMPKRSGREVYDAVATARPGTPALFLSGYTADIIHKKGLFDEGLQFLAKPLAPSELLTRVRTILDAAKARR
jgi:PAS domain S-box-containing protein